MLLLAILLSATWANSSHCSVALGRPPADEPCRLSSAPGAISSSSSYGLLELATLFELLIQCFRSFLLRIERGRACEVWVKRRMASQR